MKISFLIRLGLLSLLSFQLPAVGASKDSASESTSYDVACRTQAKDTAVKIYQSCMAENKQKRVGEIRKEYQAKLGELKKYYDGELKKLSSKGSASESGTSAEVTASATTMTKSSNKEIAKTLPAKATATRTMPIQSANNGAAITMKQSIDFDDQNGAVEVVQPGSEDDGTAE